MLPFDAVLAIDKLMSSLKNITPDDADAVFRFIAAWPGGHKLERHDVKARLSWSIVESVFDVFKTLKNADDVEEFVRLMSDGSRNAIFFGWNRLPDNLKQRGLVIIWLRPDGMLGGLAVDMVGPDAFVAMYQNGEWRSTTKCCLDLNPLWIVAQSLGIGSPYDVVTKLLKDNGVSDVEVEWVQRRGVVFCGEELKDRIRRSILENLKQTHHACCCGDAVFEADFKNS